MTTKRPWTQTSASQHEAFNGCQRFWYFGWIDRIKRPTSEAQQRGTDIHAEVEFYLRHGDFKDAKYTEASLNYRPYVDALIPYLPPPSHPELILEHRFNTQAIPGIGWVGVIDIGFSGAQPLLIRDIKSTSDFRYAKTPLELKENIQLISYAKWAYEIGHQGEIDIGHIYVKTSKKAVPKKPKAMLVNTTVDLDHVLDLWEREMGTVREMKQASLAPSAHDLPPNTSHCPKFGGCPFRDRCGLETIDFFSAFKKTKGTTDMGFLDRMKEKSKGAANGVSKKETAVAKPATKKKAKVPTGVVPDDAPSRETKVKKFSLKKKPEVEPEELEETVEDVEEEDAEEETVQEKPKKKGRPKGTKNASKAEKKGFVLYIDCMPTKDVNSGGVEPTLFEDFFDSLVHKMNEHSADERKVPHYMLLPFGEQKALIDAAVQEAVESLPPALVITSGMTGAKEVQAALTPHAALVVRALR